MVTNAPHKGDAVIARGLAKVGKTNGVGMCQKEIRQLFGVPSVGDFDGDGDADAHDAWKAAVKHGKVVKDRNLKNAPPGAYLYFSGGKNGHVALGLGGDLCVSTDAHKPGVWGKIAPTKLAKRWGMRYEGYIVITGNKFRVFDLPVTTAAVRYEVVAAKLNARRWPSMYGEVAAQRVKGFQFTSTVKAGKWVRAASLWYHTDHLKVIPATSGKPTPAAHWFTLGMWNIAGANKTGIKQWPANKDKIVARIVADNAPVVLLQEAYWFLDAKQTIPLLGYIRDHSPYRVAIYKGGRVILTRGKVKTIESGIYAPQKKAAGNGIKYATWAVLEIGGSRALLVNGHSQSGKAFGSARTKWTKELAALIETTRKAHGVGKDNTFIGGDWNGQEAKTVFKTFGFVDVASLAIRALNMKFKSLNSWKSGFKAGGRIDVIFTGTGRPITEISQTDDSALSDHNFQLAHIARTKK